MCSVISRVKPVQRALASTLRLRTNADGLNYAAAQSRRFCPGFSTGAQPLWVTSRSYCARIATTDGLFFRQVGYK